MWDVIIDTLLDTLKLIPFLFAVFLLIEFLEDKLSDRTRGIIVKAGRTGPLWGSLLGAFPQCGFSVSITNLFATRIVTVGTLIAVYLSTSDEMLPILIGGGASAGTILKFLGLKVAIGCLAGFLIDLILRSKQAAAPAIEEFCEHEHCECEGGGIWRSAIKHTLSITLFILIINFSLNVLLHYLGEDAIARLFLKGSLWSPLIAAAVGLSPNCAASVAITELYLAGGITFGSAMAGLLTSAGVALPVLFRNNRNLKQNLLITGVLYALGAVCGVIIDLVSAV